MHSVLHAAEVMGWKDRAGSTPFSLGVFAGEGVGPELTDVALAVLEVISDHSGHRFDVRRGGDIGAAAVRRWGRALSAEAIEFCTEIFAQNGAVLAGPGGDRFVYDLRRHFDLYCKLTPVCPLAALSGVGVVRAEATIGVDLVIVRENTGGLYFGEWERVETERGRIVSHRFSYSSEQVERILRIGFELASRRRRRLDLVVKPSGVPGVSELWSQTLAIIAPAHAVETNVLEIDNASYQLIARARDFDVVVAPNMFGDVLSDGAALLLGSRGVAYSGNFGPERRAVYQTAHGAAHDLAGKDLANPIAHVLALAMLLRESFGLGSIADVIVRACNRVLERGFKTRDLLELGAPPSDWLGTKAFGQQLVEAVRCELDLSGSSP